MGDIRSELAKKAEQTQENTKLTKSMSIADLIKAMEPEIQKALPSVITPERFTRMALSALNTTPKLQECTPMSFLAALMNAAQLGLEPNLDGIYKEYERGRSMADCVREVCSLYTVNQWEKEKTEKIFHMICSWEESRTKIYPILLPYEKNRELLKNVIHKKYLDLALCCCLTLEDEERNNMSVRVTEGILQQWEISEEDLFRQAYENMQNAGYHIINMMQIIKECGFEGEMPATKMFVLTNRKQLYGAAGILETDLLKNFSDRIGKNLFILPSSIHEVILIPDEGRFGESLLKEMIMDVNENVLQEEDFLADHAYYFDREKGEVRVA